jgi:vancomycin permeability regulator SanA
MNKFRLISRFYSTPVNIYNYNKINVKKYLSDNEKKKYNSYTNMYQALKKNVKIIN